MTGPGRSALYRTATASGKDTQRAGTGPEARLCARGRHRGGAWRRCCMNTRCGWGGVARTSPDPVWCNKSTVISLANRRGRVGCWTLERQCGLVPIHATTPWSIVKSLIRGFRSSGRRPCIRRRSSRRMTRSYAPRANTRAKNPSRISAHATTAPHAVSNENPVAIR